MRFDDARGLPVTAASAEAVRALDRTVAAYLAFRSDTGDRLKETFASDSGLLLGHVTRGYFMTLFETEPFAKRARQALAAAEAALAKVEATPRERSHVEALRRWTAGDLAGAAECFDDILVEAPRDAIALKMAQYLWFYLGEADAMRASLGRCLFAWDEGVPGYGYILGSWAFALEESGDYAAAESAGRRAVEIHPHDIWAAHAVAHVLEMQGRAREGVAWVGSLDRNWGDCHNFRYHILWHRCLFHLDLEEHEKALELYDREVRDQPTEDYLDISNAVSMLWRLELNGVDVGNRWEELAEQSLRHVGDKKLVFADAHYAMALEAAGERDGVDRLLAEARAWADGKGTEAEIMRESGLALLEGLVAFRRGEWGRAADLLWPIRRAVGRVGGSHAQRDVFHRTLVEAALKDGRWPLARALAAERLQRKPRSAWSWRSWGRAMAGLGDDAAAEHARENAQRAVA
jgi:tetratricopeptide (TPR) repeat protein